jgi:hypothetical protein
MRLTNFLQMGLNRLGNTLKSFGSPYAGTVQSFTTIRTRVGVQQIVLRR